MALVNSCFRCQSSLKLARPYKIWGSLELCTRTFNF
jgi:hypothetical protein